MKTSTRNHHVDVHFHVHFPNIPLYFVRRFAEQIRSIGSVSMSTSKSLNDRRKFEFILPPSSEHEAESGGHRFASSLRTLPSI